MNLNLQSLRSCYGQPNLDSLWSSRNLQTVDDHILHAFKDRLENLSWDITLFTWPDHLSWDLSIRRSSRSIFRVFRISVLRTLLNNVTSSILCGNVISDACTCDRILLLITQDSWPQIKMRTKTVLKIESFTFSTILVSWQLNRAKLALLQ